MGILELAKQLFIKHETFYHYYHASYEKWNAGIFRKEMCCKLLLCTFLETTLQLFFLYWYAGFVLGILPHIPTGFLNSCSSSKHGVQATYFSHNIFHMFGSIFDNWKYAKSVVLQDIHTIVQPAYMQQYINLVPKSKIFPCLWNNSHPYFDNTVALFL